MGVFEWVYLIAVVPISWIFISRLQRGFIIFTTLENYIVVKLIVCVLLGMFIAPACVLYSLVKADASSRKKILAGVAIFFAIWVGAYYYDENQATSKAKIAAQVNKNGVSNAAKQAIPTATQQEKAPTTSGTSGMNDHEFGIGGVQLGSNINDINNIGRAISKEKTQDGILYKFASMEITTDERGMVLNITTDNVQVPTLRGIHKGSTLNDVVKVYGANFRKTSYGNLDLYEYDQTTSNATKKILRLAVDQKTNLVSYVGSRLAVK